jgi:glutamate--cysteine ligase
MADPLPGTVRRLFPPARGRSTTRVGVELELLTRDAHDGSVVAIDRVRDAVRGAPYASAVSFEPGGQVELSLPCSPTPAALESTVRGALGALRRDCAARGVLLEAAPVDRRPAGEVPLQLSTPRYLGMQAHFDRIGPAGRRMMRQTAATQVCLDWWPGMAGLEQWRVLQLAGPFLAAALNRSMGPRSRLATWLWADPDRTAFDDRLLLGQDPVAAYAAFARCAALIVEPAEHLSTLFPPVRPRGRYLEIRFLDAQPDDQAARIAEQLAGLLYDDERRRRALTLLAPEQHRLADHWRTAALTPDLIADRGHALLGTRHLQAAGAA